MQRPNKAKSRALRKRVRAEKQRLRARTKKHKPKKWYVVQLTGIEQETIMKLRAYAKKHKISVNNAITKILKEYRDKQDGI